MKRYALRTLVAWASVLVLAATVFAQEVPFQGVVVQNDTPVRAGAGRAYYVVGELDQGGVVQVDEVIFGWNKIVPPEGVYSYVSKAFVDRRGNGETGFVNQDRTEVRAGSLKGPGESYRTQQPLLNKGDRVEILGEEGAFFKIKPPKGAYVFIGPGTVRRANPGEAPAIAPTPAPGPAVEVVPPAPVTPEPATGTTPEPTEPPVAATPTTPVTPEATDETPETNVAVNPEATPEMPETGETSDATATATPPTPAVEQADAPTTATTATAAAPDVTTQEQQAQLDAMVESGGAQTAAVSDKLKELEGRMLPEFTKPLEEQPIAAMIREYEAIARQPLPAVDRQIVRMRLAALRKNQGIADTLKSIQETQQSLTPAQEVQEIISEGRVRYDAIGRLQASSVYNGQNMPLRFRLIDPASGRTLVWVQPGTLVEPRRHLGRVVGLVGEQEYDPGVKTNVLTVTRIDVLEATGEPADEPTATQ